MKYIAFGMGKVFENCRNYNDKINIIAYTDNNYTNINEFEGIPVIKPYRLNELQYDYIVIFSTDFFEEIFNQLVNDIKVPEKKIISFLDIVQGGKKLAIQRCGKSVIKIIKKMQWYKIIDFNAYFSNLYYNRSSMEISELIILDAYLCSFKKLHPIFNNLYKSIYNLENIDLPKYDAIIWPHFLNESQKEEKFIKRMSKKIKYLLIIMPYKTDINQYKIINKFGKIIYSEYNAHGKFFIIDTRPNVISKYIKIYIVSHKEFNKPYNSIYQPIYVGKYGDNREPNDNIGDNIAKYNSFINETTALYWIWKHATDDYIGICHYRRFFLQDDKEKYSNILNECFADEIFKNYDIILPKPIFINNIKEQLKDHVDSRAFEEGWKIINSLITKIQPGYIDSFEYFFNYSSVMYPCNMFVAKKEISDNYCEWLFSFILIAVESMDFGVYDNYSQRIIGFFIERLFNVWLLKQELKIKELPILYIGDV